MLQAAKSPRRMHTATAAPGGARGVPAGAARRGPGVPLPSGILQHAATMVVWRLGSCSHTRFACGVPWREVLTALGWRRALSGLAGASLSTGQRQDDAEERMTAVRLPGAPASASRMCVT